MKKHPDFDDLPEDVKRSLSDDVPFAKIGQTINEHYKRFVSAQDRVKKEFNEIAGELTASEFFIDAFNCDWILTFRKEKDDLYLLFSNAFGVVEKLVLKNGKVSADEVNNDWCELSKTDSGYLIEIADEESGNLFTLTFTDAEHISLPVNALGFPVAIYSLENPWEVISNISCAIVGHIENNHANEKELAHAELIKFLYFNSPGEEYVHLPPEEFLKIAEKHNASSIVRKYSNSPNKLFSHLTSQKYEAMWREIYFLLAETQSGLPSEAELYCDEQTLKTQRADVTKQMRKYGFEGEYPNFFKHASLDKPQIFTSNNQVVFAGHEKDVRYYITYFEIPYKNKILLNPFCGAIFCKSAEEKTDIFSCMFNRNGKSRFEIMLSGILFELNEDISVTNELLISLAVKRIQFLPLNENEKRLKEILISPSTNMILLMFFIFSALFFGAAMTVGFMLIELIVTLLVMGSLAEFPALFMSTPWWLIGLGSGGAFGVVMTILSFIANKR